MAERKVVVVAPPAVACRNPRDMEYGGVERAAWRLTRMLAALGCEVVPVAAADSDFGQGVTSRGLSSVESWRRPGRVPPIYAEDSAALLEKFGTHVGRVIESERPAVALALGPSLPVLSAVLESAHLTRARAAAVVHNGPSDNADTIPRFQTATDLSLFCLTEAQRVSFGSLAARMEVVSDGIPVGAVPFSADPAKRRARLAAERTFAGLGLDPDRPLIGQIDYFHANKAMLTSLQVFRDSGLARTHDLLLAGGPGWQLPSRTNPRLDQSYLDRMKVFVAENGLDGSVHIHGPLTGAMVSRLYGAMDVALSPARLEDPPGQRDPESYGQGRAIANSAGTPVLMSTAYDESFSARVGLRFDDVTQGVEALRAVATSPQSRREMRAFAEKRDSLLPGLRRHAQFVGLDPPNSDLAAAVALVEREEAV
jgi:glycosyltransferase involved in cell wall biosynthesis